VEPKIISEESLLLVGLSFYGDPFNRASGWSEENEIGLLWKRLMGLIMSKPGIIKHQKKSDVFLEVHIQTDETEEKGIFEIFVGTAVEKIEDVPIELVVKQLPASRYAVFTLKGNEITSDYEKIILHEWLPSSGYEAHEKFGFQYYDSRFRGMDNIEESEIDVYVPVREIK